MKRKILLLHYLVPLIIALLALWLVLSSHTKKYETYFGIVMAIAFVFRILLSKRRYLTRLEFSNSFLKVEYLTPLFRSADIQIGLSEITDVELTRADWFADYPAALNIKTGREWKGFQILGRKLLKQIEEEISARRLTTR